MFFKYSILFLCTEIFNIHKHTLAAHPLPQCAALATVLQRQPPHTPRAHAGKRLSGMHIHAILTIKILTMRICETENAICRKPYHPLPKSLFRSKGKCPELRPSQYHDAGKALPSLHTASSVPLKSTFRVPEKAFLQARTGFSATAERLVCGAEKLIRLTVSHLRKVPKIRVFAPYRTPRSKYEALVGLR